MPLCRYIHLLTRSDHARVVIYESEGVEAVSTVDNTLLETRSLLLASNFPFQSVTIGGRANSESGIRMARSRSLRGSDPQRRGHRLDVRTPTRAHVPRALRCTRHANDALDNLYEEGPVPVAGSLRTNESRLRIPDRAAQWITKVDVVQSDCSVSEHALSAREDQPG